MGAARRLASPRRLLTWLARRPPRPTAQFLEMLQYNVSISASLYASYYFELRTLCEKKEATFNMKPLGADDARQDWAAAMADQLRRIAAVSRKSGRKVWAAEYRLRSAVGAAASRSKAAPHVF